MTYNDLRAAIGEKVKAVYTKLQDAVDAVEELATAVDELEESQAPATPSTIQATIRESNILHVQEGSRGDYKKADVELNDAQQAAFNNAFASGETNNSLAGTSRQYLVGKRYSDGSILFGDSYVLTEDPFAN